MPPAVDTAVAELSASDYFGPLSAVASLPLPHAIRPRFAPDPRVAPVAPHGDILLMVLDQRFLAKDAQLSEAANRRGDERSPTSVVDSLFSADDELLAPSWHPQGRRWEAVSA